MGEQIERLKIVINVPSKWGQGDLITELDALTEFSAKASVALSLLALT
jgi:hypothetical protein